MASKAKKRKHPEVGDIVDVVIQPLEGDLWYEYEGIVVSVHSYDKTEVHVIRRPELCNVTATAEYADENDTWQVFDF